MGHDKKVNIILLLFGIFCITLLEGLAIIKDIDGRYFSFAIGAICLICGVTITKVFRIGIK